MSCKKTVLSIFLSSTLISFAVYGQPQEKLPGDSPTEFEGSPHSTVVQAAHEGESPSSQDTKPPSLQGDSLETIVQQHSLPTEGPCNSPAQIDPSFQQQSQQSQGLVESRISVQIEEEASNQNEPLQRPFVNEDGELSHQPSPQKSPGRKAFSLREIDEEEESKGQWQEDVPSQRDERDQRDLIPVTHRSAEEIIQQGPQESSSDDEEEEEKIQEPQGNSDNKEGHIQAPQQNPLRNLVTFASDTIKNSVRDLVNLCLRRNGNGKDLLGGKGPKDL